MQKACYLHTRIKWTEIDVNIVKQSVFPYNLAQQYSLLNQRSNTGSENTYSSPSFSIKSRSVSMRLLQVMVYALPNSYFRTTGIELKRYSPLATARNMAVYAVIRFSVSFMHIGISVSINCRVRISMVSEPVHLHASIRPSLLWQVKTFPKDVERWEQRHKLYINV